MAKVVTMTEIESGVVDWVDLLKINAFLDQDAATMWKARKEAERR